MTNGFSPDQVARLLDPRSVAIVGASDKPGALGASVLANLERNGFGGDIHLVNPKRDQIGGRPCVKSVDDLPTGVDCAVLAIPRVGVLDAMRALAQREVGAAIIFSAGFAEDGEAGLADQREIARIAEAAGMIVEGPNCLGCVNHVAGTPLTFVETECRAPAGDSVAVVSQSGAMAAVLATTLQARDLDIGYTVSTGNEAVSGVEDYLEWIAGDAATKVVAMIVEHFRSPQRFLKIARRLAAMGKTIVLLHPGRSAAARKSAATHTGAIAGDHAVMRTLCADAGVILCDTLQELGDVTELVLRCPPVGEGGVAVVGESGAFKAITLDLADTLNLPLAALGDDDSPALRGALPEFVPVSNPLDITAMGLSQPHIYTDTLTALLDDKRVGAVVIGIIQTDDTTCNLKFPAIEKAVDNRTVDKPLIYCGLDEGAPISDALLQHLRDAGIPVFPSAERVFRALAALDRRRLPGGPSTASGSETALQGLDDLSGTIPEYLAKRILGPAGIPFPNGELARNASEAKDIAARLGFPVAIKAQAATLSHKSDAGGVAIGLGDGPAVAAAYEKIASSVAAYNSDIALDGLLIEAMGERGVEMIVGAKRDPDWGTVLLVGFGGVTAELIEDVALIPPGADDAAIRQAVLSLKQAPLLTGFRGAPAGDIDALVRVVSKLSEVMKANARIAEIDLNPVVITPGGAIALDALIELAD